MDYQSLLDKKIAADIATNMERSQQSEQFTIADRARVPSNPVKPRRMILYGLAGLGSLAFSMAIGLLLEFRKNQFLGEWELAAGVRVLGRIPTIASESAV
jgi:uncharacterized protein involved in exopolysaccharide biosynthesis